MKYFKESEVACKCGCKMGISTQLAILLDLIREEFGHPITISSGARCQHHNDTMIPPGAKHSTHVSGRAVDMVSTPELAKFIINNLVKYNLRMESLDVTPGWIHIDLNYRGTGPRIFRPGKPSILPDGPTLDEINRKLKEIEKAT